jgi:hypothetical protein
MGWSEMSSSQLDFYDSSSKVLLTGLSSCEDFTNAWSDYAITQGIRGAVLWPPDSSSNSSDLTAILGNVFDKSQLGCTVTAHL